MKILAVSHAADRSGAPKVLLLLLQELSATTSGELRSLVLRFGPLRAQFHQVAPALPIAIPFLAASGLSAMRRHLELGSRRRLLPLLNVAQACNSLFAHALAHLLRYERFDVVYANSVASGSAIRSLAPLFQGTETKLVVHVHENAWALQQLAPQWAYLKRHAHHFIAASHAIGELLVKAEGISPQRVTVIHEWVDFSALKRPGNHAEERAQLRDRLGVPAGTFLVGGCGTAEWRKGIDRLPELAMHFQNCHFVWQGGHKNAFRQGIIHDAQRMGVQERIHFLDESANPSAYFAGLDVHCLLSREEAFPLVVIEAAAQQVPTVCFADAGGAPELVGQGAGRVLPYGDICAMARALEELREDSELRLALGRQAEGVARSMSDVHEAAPKVLALLEKLAEERSHPV